MFPKDVLLLSGFALLLEAELLLLEAVLGLFPDLLPLMACWAWVFWKAFVAICCFAPWVFPAPERPVRPRCSPPGSRKPGPAGPFERRSPVGSIRTASQRVAPGQQGSSAGCRTAPEKPCLGPEPLTLKTELLLPRARLGPACCPWSCRMLLLDRTAAGPDRVGP